MLNSNDDLLTFMGGRGGWVVMETLSVNLLTYSVNYFIHFMKSSDVMTVSVRRYLYRRNMTFSLFDLKQRSVNKRENIKPTARFLLLGVLVVIPVEFARLTEQ